MSDKLTFHQNLLLNLESSADSQECNSFLQSSACFTCCDPLCFLSKLWMNSRISKYYHILIFNKALISSFCYLWHDHRYPVFIHKQLYADKHLNLRASEPPNEFSSLKKSCQNLSHQAAVVPACTKPWTSNSKPKVLRLENILL